VDRVYLDTPGTVKILDENLGRVIHVEKENSASTVVWNPWVDKAARMPDFGNDEYQRMVCVESGNVMENGMRLAPGDTSKLTLRCGVLDSA
jgi:D-hexose-6-phosphate mutarotase